MMSSGGLRVLMRDRLNGAGRSVRKWCEKEIFREDRNEALRRGDWGIGGLGFESPKKELERVMVGAWDISLWMGRIRYGVWRWWKVGILLVLFLLSVTDLGPGP